jgi:opacity protein-like surface antigen
MKAWIGIAMATALTACATMAASAQESKPAADAQAKAGAGAVVADDNMTPYRKMAADTLTAFKAHDMPTAKKQARALEVAWDKGEKTLEKKSPDVWKQIDKAMDEFIKPVMHDKSPDPAKVQTAYDAFISKLQLAVKSDAPKS